MNGMGHMEVLDVLPHISQTVDALAGAEPKNFVIVPGCQLDEGLHVGGASIQESFGALIELLRVLDQL